MRYSLCNPQTFLFNTRVYVFYMISLTGNLNLVPKLDPVRHFRRNEGICNVLYRYMRKAQHAALGLHGHVGKDVTAERESVGPNWIPTKQRRRTTV